MLLLGSLSPPFLPLLFLFTLCRVLFHTVPKMGSASCGLHHQEQVSKGQCEECRACHCTGRPRAREMPGEQGEGRGTERWKGIILQAWSSPRCAQAALAQEARQSFFTSHSQAPMVRVLDTCDHLRLPLKMR